jgi:hypothetical protein
VMDFVNTVSEWWTGMLKFITDTFGTVIDGIAKGLVFVGALVQTRSLDAATKQAASIGEGQGAGVISASFKASLDMLAPAAGAATSALGILKDSFFEGLGVIRDAFSGIFGLGEAAKRAASDVGGGGSGGAGFRGANVGAAFMRGVTDVTERIVNEAYNLPPMFSRTFRKIHDVGALAFSEVRFALEDASEAMRERIERGGQTFGETVYNTLADVLGPSIASAAIAFGEAVAGAAQQVAGVMVSKLGEVGSILQSGIQGFQAGGVFGAAAAVIAELLSRTESFGKLLAMLNASLGVLTRAIDPMVKAILPVFKGFDMFARLLTLMGSSMLRIEPVFQVTAKVLEVVGNVMQNAMVAVAKAFNFVISKIADVVAFFDEDWAKALRKMKISTGDLYDRDESEELRRTDRTGGRTRQAVDDLAGKFDDLGKVVDDVSGSLSNVPSGYKVALAQFDATQGVSPLGGQELASGAAGARTFGDIYIQSNDPEEIWRKIQGLMEHDAFVGGGSIVGGAPPYAVLKQRV